jgi:hypothetical protein
VEKKMKIKKRFEICMCAREGFIGNGPVSGHYLPLLERKTH